ncbi:MAG: tetratricopeptide repeat protein, partial [Nannocystaceae bacterium]
IVATEAMATASRGRFGLYGASAGVLMALACGAKMSAAGLPVLWLLVCTSDPWRRTTNPVSTRALPRLLTVFVLMAVGVVAVLAHTYWVTGSVVPYGGAVDLRLHANRVGQSAVLAASMPMQLGYFQQMLVPLGLSPEYVDTTGSWTDLATVLATTAWVAIIGYGVWCIRRRPLVACVLLGFVVLALPTANFVPMPNMRAERLMYLPSLPVCLGLAAALLALGRRLATRLGPVWALAPIAVMAVIQGSALMAACGTYRSNRQLWMVAEVTAPGSARAQALVAESLLVPLRSLPESEPAHKILQARIEAHCTNAERLDSSYELSHLCFARLAIVRRDWATASRRLQQALAVSVDRHARIYATLAEVSLDNPGLAPTKRSQQAQDFLTRGLLSYPYSPELAFTAGKLHHLQGDSQQALMHLRKARSLAPERGAVVLKQIEVLLDVGDLQRAREIWLSDRQVIVRANPALRSALGTRLERAERLFPSPASASILSPGVFTDEP